MRKPLKTVGTIPTFTQGKHLRERCSVAWPVPEGVLIRLSCIEVPRGLPGGGGHAIAVAVTALAIANCCSVACYDCIELILEKIMALHGIESFSC